jgi:hypothetical protein
MYFNELLKGRVTESIVLVSLQHSEYHIVSCGIEQIIVGINTVDYKAYKKLNVPQPLRSMPDFAVLQAEQLNLIEVKYRSTWKKDDILAVEKQAEIFGTLTAVFACGKPPEAIDCRGLDKHLRCCMVKFNDGKLRVEIRPDAASGAMLEFVEFDDIVDEPALWYRLPGLREKFPKLKAECDSLIIGAVFESMAKDKISNDSAPDLSAIADNNVAQLKQATANRGDTPRSRPAARIQNPYSPK